MWSAKDKQSAERANALSFVLKPIPNTHKQGGKLIGECWSMLVLLVCSRKAYPNIPQGGLLLRSLSADMSQLKSCSLQGSSWGTVGGAGNCHPAKCLGLEAVLSVQRLVQKMSCVQHAEQGLSLLRRHLLP